MPVFEFVSRYPHPRDVVFAWHTRPGAFIRLTPPGMATMVEGPHDGINPGSEMVVRVSHPLLGLVGEGKAGPRVGVNWRVRHVEYVEGESFVDEQVEGPFKTWRHEHHFADGAGGSTVVTDRVTWELPIDTPGRLVDAVVEMQLDGLFSFRQRQLHDDLELHARLGARPRHVVVAGASGLVGTQLVAALASGGHRVTRLVRSVTSARPLPGNAVAWDPASGTVDAGAIEDVDAVVNLSGHSIAGRFSRDHRTKIYRSRMESTTTLARAVLDAGVPSLVQASAIGYYGARRPGELLREDSAPGEGFLADVVAAWEDAARPAVEGGARVAWLRTGIVLTEGGGALAPQVPLYSVGLGGRLGAPDAWMSWIGLDDLTRSYVQAVMVDALEGPVNAVAPRPVTNREFADTLGHVLHRPSAIPTPTFGPKLLLGAEGYDQLIDTDQRVSSAKLGESGFRFAQNTLADALQHALMR